MDGVAVELCNGKEPKIFNKLILQTSSWCLDIKFIDLIFLVLGSDSVQVNVSLSNCATFYFPELRWK